MFQRPSRLAYSSPSAAAAVANSASASRTPPPGIARTDVGSRKTSATRACRLRARTQSTAATTTPSSPVTIVDWYEQSEAIIDGRIVVGFLRRPFDDHGIRSVVVGREPAVALFPRTHPLATRRSVSLQDLKTGTILDGVRRRTATIEEKLELIAAGLGVAMLPESVASAYSAKELVIVRVLDASPHDLCVAVLSATRKPLVRAFFQTAADVLPQSHQLEIREADNECATDLPVVA